MRLSGKTVLVTGAGSGSGEAVVHRFVAEGATIVALGRRAGPLEALAQSRFGGLLDVDGGTTSLNPGRLGYTSAYRAATGRS